MMPLLILNVTAQNENQLRRQLYRFLFNNNSKGYLHTTAAERICDNKILYLLRTRRRLTLTCYLLLINRHFRCTFTTIYRLCQQGSNTIRLGEGSVFAAVRNGGAI